jgi:hypothetical protein
MLGAAVPVVELTICPTALAGHEHLAAVVIGAIAALPTLLRAWTVPSPRPHAYPPGPRTSRPRPTKSIVRSVARHPVSPALSWRSRWDG